MRALLASCSFGFALTLSGLVVVQPVLADTSAPTTIDALSASMGSVPATPVVPTASVVEAPVASAPDLNDLIIFQMADGRFFNPTTGLVAATEADLRSLVMQRGVGANVSGGFSSTDNGEAIPPVPTVDPLVVAVRAAQAELRARIAADTNPNPPQIKERPATLNITLAIWQRDTNQLRYVEAKMKGTDLQIVGEGDQTDDELRVLRANGVNSQITVNGNTNEIVVAIRYPILVAANSKKTLFTLQDVVYVPYSRALHSAAMVDEGEKYLDDLTKRVFDRLRSDGTRSKAYPDRLMADVIDPALVKAVSAIEHSDESALQKDTNNALEQFFVILGGNQGEAYNYARSSADALGLVQFIPSTYNRLAARSEWGLDTNFERGMQNHENAMRAQVIYLDTLLTEFPETIRKQYLQDPDTTSEYIVAAYNGGSGRVRKAIATWQQVFNGQRTRQLQQLQQQYTSAFAKAESLRLKTLAEKDKKKRATLQGQLDAQRKVYRSLQSQIDTLQASILRQETIGYVQKYRLTRADERFLPRPVLTATSIAIQQTASPSDLLAAKP